MKILMISTLVLFLISVTGARAEDEQYTGIDRYKKQVVEPSFSTRFKGDEDMNNFKRLREFLSEKEQLKKDLGKELETISDRYDEREMQAWQDRIAAIDSLTRNKMPSDNIELSAEEHWDLFIRRYSKYWGGMRRQEFTPDAAKKTVSAAQLGERKLALAMRIQEIREDSLAILNLKRNIDNVESDLNECRNQIDSALTPVIKDQSFRKDISFAFTILIGVLLVAFFASLFWKADGGLADDMLSANGLQFITLFVLIIAIILFGILGILQGSELAAILSGISGYILGKGNQGPKAGVGAQEHRPSGRNRLDSDEESDEIMTVRRPQAGPKEQIRT